ncbi:MAG TPA: 2-C-methyl-D-erythritol 4-phosphate cytidylyltransferase [Vicinamibacterales bacterium]|nr:2-C-methyl-D-erythritol 4-phosphate cytidylyltransferase [Vicinamibacterales bacterium]
MYVVAIIAAAGQGQRLGAQVPKQLVSVAGRTLLQRSVDAFARCARVNEIIIAAPIGAGPEFAGVVETHGKPLRQVAGGERRQDSVANAFDAAPPSADIIVVHDAARAFVSPELIDRTIDAAAEAGAAIAAAPARDTVKRVAVEGRHGAVIRETIPRGEVYLAQTPQAFRRAVLGDAIRRGRAGAEATDEAMLAEQAGHPVRIVESDETNIKVTTPQDLAIAEALAADPRSAFGIRRSAFRVGVGYDLHRLVEGRPLVLGGVTIPFDRGPLAHSDGDAICHALTDAVLGAAAAGDIGRHFPDTDPRWKDANSVFMLQAAVQLAGERGLQVDSADVVVILERPKLAPHVDAMVAKMAETLGVPADRVSVKAKTNEGVDAVGRGEAVAVHAVATLRSA